MSWKMGGQDIGQWSLPKRGQAVRIDLTRLYDPPSTNESIVLNFPCLCSTVRQGNQLTASLSLHLHAGSVHIVRIECVTR
jgi:hypothetical protein